MRKNNTDDWFQYKMSAVVFDMDGVIFDSEQLCRACWEQIAKEQGLPDMHRVFEKCIGVNRRESKRILTKEYGSDFDYERFASHAANLFHKHARQDGLPVKPGVVELLRCLKEHQIPIGLASSTRIAVVEEELKQAGIYEYFDVVIGGDLLKASKPAPDIYLLACEKLGVAPEQAYAIEDSYNGIRSAYAANMHPIMVPDLLPANEEMKEKSVFIITSLEELEEHDGVMGCI